MAIRAKVERKNSEEAGYRLGLVMNRRQQYGSYDWSKALKVAARETGSNALRLELQILNWGPDSQQRDVIVHEPPSDVRGAIAIAKELVESGYRMAEVRGYASRMYAQKGFGDRAYFDLAMVEPEE